MSIVMRVFLGMVLVFVLHNSGIANAAMTYDEAISYQKNNAKEIYIMNRNWMDHDYSYDLHYTLNLFKKNGHKTGGLGLDEYTKINLGIDYGIGYGIENPHVFLQWEFSGLKEIWNTWSPCNFIIEFTNGTCLIYSIKDDDNFYKVDEIQRNYYKEVFHSGRIIFSDDEFMEICKSGNIDQIYISSNDGRMYQFFYNLPKQVGERNILNKGLYHAAAIMQIDDE